VTPHAPDRSDRSGPHQEQPGAIHSTGLGPLAQVGNPQRLKHRGRTALRRTRRGTTSGTTLGETGG
jgi:hypothetical protein